MSHHNLPQYRNAVATPTWLSRISAILPDALVSVVQLVARKPDYESLSYANAAHTKTSTSKHVRWKLSTSWKRSLNLPNAFVSVWIVVLLWGERWIFESSIAACEWKNWERWPKAATPHRMVLLADPQIVDPHTYLGRPWPLDKLTYLQTDNYMRRSYTQIQKHIHPDTVFFLGDLFDGGREWAAREGSTDDPEWVSIKRSATESKYAKNWKEHFRDAFWIKEYFRFGSMFFDHWNDFGEHSGAGQRGRKIITGLPGNHDIGFGTNVRELARNRFQTYFGESNRVDVIGNHTFVSVDGLSLSARSLARPETRQIAIPVEEFLNDVQGMKRRAVARELKYLAGEPEYLKQAHTVVDTSAHADVDVPTFDSGSAMAEFPSILLTHVPLYRDSGAACGPLRERMPPASPPIRPDVRNGIPLAAGYQYQNVLSDTDSIDVLNKVGDVVHVFSGDDHDYCELMHTQAQGGVKEITVKSMSFAMGVRKPAFLQVSLWNPVDASGQSIGTHSSGHGAHFDRKTGLPLTIETHLCHQPNEIGILIHYVLLICASLIVLIIRAILVPIYSLTPFSPKPYTSTADAKMLPVSMLPEDYSPSFQASSDTIFSHSQSVAPRSTGARNRSGSITPVSTYGYGVPTPQATPTPQQARYYVPNGSHKRDDDEEAAGEKGKRRAARDRPLTKAEVSWREAWTSIWRVAWVVVLWYSWLSWNG